MSMVPSEAISSIAEKLGCEEDWDEILDEIGSLQVWLAEQERLASERMQLISWVCQELGADEDSEAQILGAVRRLKNDSGRVRQTALFFVEQLGASTLQSVRAELKLDRAIELAEHFEHRLVVGPPATDPQG